MRGINLLDLPRDILLRLSEFTSEDPLTEARIRMSSKALFELMPRQWSLVKVVREVLACVAAFNRPHLLSIELAFGDFAIKILTSHPGYMTRDAYDQGGGRRQGFVELIAMHRGDKDVEVVTEHGGEQSRVQMARAQKVSGRPYRYDQLLTFTTSEASALRTDDDIDREMLYNTLNTQLHLKYKRLSRDVLHSKITNMADLIGYFERYCLDHGTKPRLTSHRIRNIRIQRPLMLPPGLYDALEYYTELCGESATG